MSLLLLLAACAVEPCPPGFADGAEPGQCEFDEAAVRALVADLHDGPLVEVNEEPYLPVYSATPIRRRVWITPLRVEGTVMDTVDLYLSIDQDDWSSPLVAPFPVGTVIVHEAVDGEEPHGVEVKRDDYEDELGRQWWLRMIDDEGTIEDPSAREACADCHNKDYRPSGGLWGIPTSAK